MISEAAVLTCLNMAGLVLAYETIIFAPTRLSRWVGVCFAVANGYCLGFDLMGVMNQWSN